MMRSPIPKEIREQLSADKFMKTCIVARTHECEGRIEWHHGFQYASKRRNEIWAILPICSKGHREEAKYRWLIEDSLRYRIRHFKAEEEFRKKYPKSTLVV